MGTSAITGINLGVPAYQLNFTNSNLVAGVLTVNHNLNSQYVSVTVYNNSDVIIIPDDVTATSTTVSTIDLTSYGTISGTWRAVIIDKGATNAFDGTATNLNLTGQTSGDRVVYNGTAWVRKEACSFKVRLVNTDGQQYDETDGYDIGGNFASNTFTAPVDGLYYMCCAIRQTSNNTTIKNPTLSILGSSGEELAGNYVCYPNTASPGYFSVRVSGIMNLSASETVTIVFTNTGAAAVSINDITISYWCGHLLA